MSPFDIYKGNEEKMIAIAKALDKAILPAKLVLPKNDPFWIVMKPKFLLNYFIYSTVLLILIATMK